MATVDGMGYFGSKEGSGLYQAIVAQMPPHETYIEMFLGGGSVMRHKPASARDIGIDRDPGAVAEFDCAAGREIICSDAIAYVAGFDYSSSKRVLIYADPPYVLSTRTSSKRYKFDFTDEDHRRLAAVLRAVPASVILSGYPSPLYDDLFGDWRSVRMQAMTRGGVRTEQIWFNYPAADVAWSSYAGKDRTQRQHIKRKAARWQAKFRQCSPGERLAILAALMDADA